LDIIEKRGSFYSYKDERLAQGRENAKLALKENPALCLEIENAIRHDVGFGGVKVSSAFAFDGDRGSDDDEAPEEVEELEAELD
jgi:recombination protein RecA